MGLGIALALLLLAQNQPAPAAEDHIKKLIHEIAASGRVVSIGARAAERVNPPKQVPPGAPPLLLFRYLDGMGKHRFGQLGLVIDDAGH